MIWEVIFQDCSSLIKIDTKWEEEFSKTDTGIDISDNKNISSLIKVIDNFFDFNFALDLFFRGAHNNDGVIFESIIISELNFIGAKGIGDFNLVLFGFISSGTF